MHGKGSLLLKINVQKESKAPDFALNHHMEGAKLLDEVDKSLECMSVICGTDDEVYFPLEVLACSKTFKRPLWKSGLD